MVVGLKEYVPILESQSYTKNGIGRQHDPTMIAIIGGARRDQLGLYLIGQIRLQRKRPSCAGKRSAHVRGEAKCERDGPGRLVATDDLDRRSRPAGVGRRAPK